MPVVISRFRDFHFSPIQIRSKRLLCGINSPRPNDSSETSFFEKPELMCVQFTIQQENDVKLINNALQGLPLYFVAGENRDSSMKNRSIAVFSILYQEYDLLDYQILLVVA